MIHIGCGDMREALAQLEPESVHACVTDPPYELGFMGKDWDKTGVAFDPAAWVEVYRVLKPGGYLLAFSATRTYHRMAVAIEDAGFEIKDQILWLYGAGMPKGINVNKALSAAGQICTCDSHTVQYSHGNTSRENMRTVRQDVDTEEPLPGGAEHPLLEGMLASDHRAEGIGTTLQAEPQSGSHLPGLREGVPTRTEPRGAGEVADVLAPMQRGDTWSGVEAARIQGPGGLDGCEPSVLRTEDDRAGESGMAGRRNLHATAGQLPSGQGGEVSGIASGDGTQGRLHHRASAGDVADDRAHADLNGSRSPSGPQPAEQRARQPRVMAGQREPQGYGAWPDCPWCGLPILSPGINSGIKPAAEPICVARKPFKGTIVNNVLTHGTGAYNVDACRIATEDDLNGGAYSPSVDGMSQNEVFGKFYKKPGEFVQPSGRWPANVCLDEAAAAALDAMSGERPGDNRAIENPGRRDSGFLNVGSGNGSGTPNAPVYADRGGPSRFFYTAKASQAERNIGHAPGERNTHATVKPIDLMQWLVRLVTPKGGTVLDPFMGSGSTGVACVREGFSFVGIDIGEENVETSRKRIGSAIPKSIQLDLMGGDSMFEREVEEIKELDRLFVIARQSRQERDWKAYDDAEASFNARSRVDLQTLHRDDPGDSRSASCQRH